MDKCADGMTNTTSPMSGGMARLELMDHRASGSIRELFSFARRLQVEKDEQLYACRSCHSLFSRAALREGAGDFECPTCKNILFPHEVAMRMDTEEENKRLRASIEEYQSATGVLNDATKRLQAVSGITASKEREKCDKALKTHADRLCGCLEDLMNAHHLDAPTKQRLSSEQRRTIGFAKQAIASYRENVK
jgi:predicted RNA-binding Zn-ribbon protein involved in translation (DUF1610 family)